MLLSESTIILLHKKLLFSLFNITLFFVKKKKNKSLNVVNTLNFFTKKSLKIQYFLKKEVLPNKRLKYFIFLCFLINFLSEINTIFSLFIFLKKKIK